MKNLLRLYLIFLKIGSVTFGGGLAMYPVLRREFIEERGWITEEELTDYYAVGQCTPGVVAINVSTFIGDKRGGAAGGFAATFGFVTAPLFIIALLAASLRAFAEYPVVRDAFAGVRVCVCVLVVNAVARLWRNSVTDGATFFIFALVFALCAVSPLLPFSVSPAAVVAASALFGAAWRRCKRGGR
ncbi:chromate transporter [Synergistes jonesii]|uniref:chromate transporter n=1 Tax=Synergistes jonesii TaxID=2754 RepID=UPI00332503A0